MNTLANYDEEKSNKHNLSNTSPLRYPGGKTRACKKLDTIMKDNFDITKFTNIVSPFFGGGSFEFRAERHHNQR